MNSKKAFSLIETIIATGILSITVFWIYKLIWENNKIVANSNNFLTQNLVYENAEECLKWEDFDWKKFIDFWNDLKSCNIWNTEKTTTIDNIDYTISANSVKLNWKIVFWKIKVDSSVTWPGEEKTFKQ